MPPPSTTVPLGQDTDPPVSTPFGAENSPTTSVKLIKFPFVIRFGWPFPPAA
jgi:hypothetical protein